jgi:copper chaperone CopZ
MKNIGIVIVVFSLFAFVKTEEQKEPKVKEITFLTSAICEDCKERIEKELNYTKGVIYAELDMESKEVTVKYKTKFLAENDVKKVVANVGYDAGDMKRNEMVFEELPTCCKSPGHCAR